MTDQKILNAQMWNAIRGRDSSELDEGSLQALTVALDLGANPNCLYVDEKGNPGTQRWHSKLTPLLYITEHMYDESPNFRYQEQMAALLIKKGANVNARDDSNYTPLMNAVKGNALNTAKLLINKGADIDARWEYGNPKLYSNDWDIRTALGFVRTSEMMQMLLDHGANPNKSEDNFGNSPLHQACEHMYYDYCGGENANQYLKMIAMLLDHGADPNAWNLRESTPMMIICGADIDEKYIKDVSSDVKLAVIKMLFEHGARINAESYRKTALGYAAASEDWTVVRALAFNGAHINRDVVPYMEGEKRERVQKHLGEIVDELLEFERQEAERRRQEKLREQMTWKPSPAQKMADLQQGQKIVDAMGKAKKGSIHKPDEHSM